MILGHYKDGDLPSAMPFMFVDVRDVAAAHVKALELPEAGGQRFFIVSSYFSNKRIANVIRLTHPELTDRLPSADSLDDFPPKIYGFDNSKSRKVLGMTYRDLKTSVDDTVTSMLQKA
jgi:nucleoside-diphosphate-sugar epimerase